MKRVLYTILGVIALAGFVAQAATSTTSATEKTGSTALDVGGSAKFRGYSFNNRDFRKELRDSTEWMYSRFRLDLGYEPSDTVKGFAQLQYSRIFGNSGYSGSPYNDLDGANLHQAYIHWSPAQFDVVIGRQGLNYGDGFVISNNDMENGVSFDAIRVSYNSSYLFFDQIDWFGSIVAERNDAPTSTDVYNTSGVAVTADPWIPGLTKNDERDAYFTGLYLQKKEFFVDNFDLYALYYNEGFSRRTNTADAAMFPHSAATTVTPESIYVSDYMTYGTRIKTTAFKMWDGSIEGGIQTGTIKTLNYVEKRTPWNKEGKLRARALSAETGVKFGPARIAATYMYASGDDKKTKDKQEGWQSLYGPMNYTMARWGILAFSNVTDYALRAQYEMNDDVRFDGGVHQIMVNDIGTGPVYAGSRSANAPHSSNPFPTDDTNDKVVDSSKSDFGRVFDVSAMYRLNPKADLTASVFTMQPGKRFKGSNWATLGFVEAAFKF